MSKVKAERRKPTFEITIRVEAARKESIEKSLRAVFGTDVPIHTIEKLTTPESRADRLSQAECLVADGLSIIEELKDEMEQWFDSIPENLQSGDKAGEVEAARDQLDNIQSELENLDWGVDFPGMF